MTEAEQWKADVEREYQEYRNAPTWYAVYGIFDDKTCLYVGRTKNAYYREQNHKCRFGKHIVFKVFNWTKSNERACKLEHKYIREYKDLGQAEHNKTYGRSSRSIAVAMSLLLEAIELLERDAPEGCKTDTFCKRARKFLS